jgi:hypothetical protein
MLPYCRSPTSALLRVLNGTLRLGIFTQLVKYARRSVPGGTMPAFHRLIVI